MSTEPEVYEEIVGAHIMRFEPPDLVCARIVGDLSADDVAALARTYRRAPGRLYSIIITSELGSISSAAKKAVRDIPVAHGVAIVGASRQMQLVISLLNKVLMIANLGKNNPITFVETEEEARRWVEHLRNAPSPR